MTRYIVLPELGFTSDALRTSMPISGAKSFPASRPRPAARPGTTPPQSLEVLDSIHEDGPRLVEMTEAAELEFRLLASGLIVVPVVYYQPSRMTYEVRQPLPHAVAPVAGIRIRLRDAEGTGIADVDVAAFTDFAQRRGDQGVSDARGEVTLRIRPGTRIERLYAFPRAGYWGHLAQEVVLDAQHDILLRPIDLDDPGLLLRRFNGGIPDGAGRGVTVGILDTGVDGGHPALGNVGGGRNLVFDEIAANPEAVADWGPARVDGDHGTHVAGIAGGQPVQGWRGVASGVTLRSYRVFPHAGGGASNYDIAKAIDLAAAPPPMGDGCQILNLSLGGRDPDPLVRRAIDRAREHGALCVVAAGNDGRRGVSYPAAWPNAVAVSAMGRRGSFPADSTEVGDIAAPFGAPPEDEAFIALFSNIGPEIDLTGPGVGVVSAVQAGRFAAMSGTSMACPAVAGFAAAVLASRPDILALQGAARVQALRTALFESAQPLGFGRRFEGFGLPAAPPGV